MDWKWKWFLNCWRGFHEIQSAFQILPTFQHGILYQAGTTPFIQLNMYGFRKVKEGDKQYYMHKCFRRDKPELSAKITRRPEKKVFISEDSSKNIMDTDQ